MPSTRSFPSRAIRRLSRRSHTLFVVALGCMMLALWLAPGLQARAVSAVSGPSTKNPFEQVLAASGSSTLDAIKLLLAAIIGFVITGVQRATRRDMPITRAMAHSYVLLCVAGALTMALIGESVPRAFGVAGAASIVKFRTPVDDPRDGTSLFLLMGLGMACGVGAFGIAITGTIFLAACLIVLSQAPPDTELRSMRVAVVADGHAFPVAHVSQVFSNHSISVEPLEISHGEQTIIRYRAVLTGDHRLEEVTQKLLEHGDSGIRSVSWETPKRWG